MVLIAMLKERAAAALGSAALLVATGLARKPEGLSWGGLWGMSILCGIGFTMSLFIGSLAFETGADDYVIANRIGILAGSLVSALGATSCCARCCRGARPPSSALHPSNANHPLEGSP